MAQWVTNPTSMHADVGVIPGPTQWVRHCVAVVVVYVGRRLQLQFNPSPGNLHMPLGMALKRPKRGEKKRMQNCKIFESFKNNYSHSLGSEQVLPKLSESVAPTI